MHYASSGNAGQSLPIYFFLPLLYNILVDKNRALTVSGVLLSIFLLGVFLRLAKSFLIPFVLALLIYFIISPLLDLLAKWKIPRSVAVGIILLATALVLYLMGVMFYESGKSFALEIPKYGHKLGVLIESVRQTFHMSATKWDPLTWLQTMDINKLGSVALTSLGTFLSFISNLFLVLIFLIFMLAGRGKINEKIARSFSPPRASQLGRIIHNIDGKIQKYLVIKTAISVTSGILTTFILMAFGVDFAVVFGFITFLLNYIPQIGSFISKVFPFLIAIVQFSSVWKAVWILVILTFVDALWLLVEPRLMGRGLGLSPLAILFFLFFWGWLWGIPGMILAVPLMSVLKIILSNFPSFKFVEALLSK